MPVTANSEPRRCASSIASVEDLQRLVAVADDHRQQRGERQQVRVAARAARRPRARRSDERDDLVDVPAALRPLERGDRAPSSSRRASSAARCAVRARRLASRPGRARRTARPSARTPRSAERLVGQLRRQRARGLARDRGALGGRGGEQQRAPERVGGADRAAWTSVRPVVGLAQVLGGLAGRASAPRPGRGRAAAAAGSTGGGGSSSARCR